MGAPSLEARLRARLALVLAPTLTVLALVAVFVTSHALDAVDDARARSIARGVAQSVRFELSEGDTMEDALREAAAGYDAHDVRVAFAKAPPAERSENACVSRSLEGAAWRTCTTTKDGLRVEVTLRTDAHEAALFTLAQWMVGVVLLAIGGSFVAARFALRAPLAELVRLGGWAARMSSGELAPPPTGTTREIETVSRACGELVQQLTLALTRERASSAHIAHELRTPLTAIIAELGAMPSGDARVERVRGDAERLARVIDAILLLSLPSRSRRADTVVNVADVARRLAPAGAAVEAPDEALVEAEPHLVELAIHNLLENAAKYAPGGASAVRVTRESDRLRVGVCDRGPALDDATRDRMFERYWRETAEGDGNGLGLGLALVRAVAERHGGEATAKNLPENAGKDVGFTMGPLLGWHAEEPR